MARCYVIFYFQLLISGNKMSSSSLSICNILHFYRCYPSREHIIRSFFAFSNIGCVRNFLHLSKVNERHILKLVLCAFITPSRAIKFFLIKEIVRVHYLVISVCFFWHIVYYILHDYIAITCRYNSILQTNHRR